MSEDGRRIQLRITGAVVRDADLDKINPVPTRHLITFCAYYITLSVFQTAPACPVSLFP